ncbi:hypothetical protein EXW39_29410 (plasmid) [Bacillus mycoides]|uniref:hypothetical protein n=1 Tax=Bacillus mycoides TaxID=1405 RepID=UPI001C00CFB5|nr:hypothetical protein [Bacillus mycoides]QWH64188.1 hypothetical protein EXW39_29410 [Bacillus mycoides]
MNIIDLEFKRKQKTKENILITIPIIERVFEVNGELQFEVTGEKEIPIAWLEKGFRIIHLPKRIGIILIL